MLFLVLHCSGNCDVDAFFFFCSAPINILDVASCFFVFDFVVVVVFFFCLLKI